MQLSFVTPMKSVVVLTADPRLAEDIARSLSSDVSSEAAVNRFPS